MSQPPGPYDTPRPPKSYLGEAVLTLMMYYFGLWVAGFIANLYFLRQVRRDRAEGIPTKYVGCLHVVQWVQGVRRLAALGGLVVFLAAQGCRNGRDGSGGSQPRPMLELSACHNKPPSDDASRRHLPLR